MKIGIKHHSWEKAVYDWGDLISRRTPKDAQIKPYFLELCKFARILSANKKFINCLCELRKKYKFDKFDLTDEELYALQSLDKKLFERIKNNIEEGKKHILLRFKIDSRWDYLIGDLVLFGYLAPGDDLFYSDAGWYKNKNSFVIEIYHPVTKNYLHKLVDGLWKSSKKEIESLPKFNIINISDRDMRIVELRDEFKMKYSEIANKVVQEFKINSMDGSINEDSVKTAYKRAIEKINSINKKR